jgi:hypothetical protein
MVVVETVHNVIIHTENSFTVVLSQLVAGAIASIPITIHTFMIASPQWPNPNESLPVATGVVHLVGDVISIENNQPLLILKTLHIIAL